MLFIFIIQKKHVHEYELKNPIIYEFLSSKTNNAPTLLELMLVQAYSLARKYRFALAIRCFFIICTGILGGNLAYSEIFPDSRTPLAQIGDIYENKVNGIPYPK